MERRLGKGLGSLLGGGVEEAEEAQPSALPVDRIRPNPHQPRREFDPGALSELAASLKEHGVLQPIVVRPATEGFEIIAGERRWRAARQAGLVELPAVIRDVPDDQMLELALVENVQRQDLDPIEKGRGYQRMIDRLGLTQERVAEKVGLNRATIANHLRLLELPEAAQEAVSKGLIQMGHARALCALGDERKLMGLVERIAREGLSVRQAEQLVRQQLPGRSQPTATPSSGTLRPRAAWVGDQERRLRDALGAKVSIQDGPHHKGRIVLEYSDRDELDGLLERLAPKRRI